MKEKQPKYYLGAGGEFVIENYNHAKPFASFFPGIAGKYGIPMWVFYVNRAQAISSFGTRDKDQAILEFFPANKAWQLTSTYGFRTFLKVSSAGQTIFYEPFRNGHFDLRNKLAITSYDLKIQEENLSLGLQIEVEYFTIPQDSYAALARAVTIRNKSKKAKKIQVLDGLPQIVPFGTNNFFLKKMGRTIEAWMNVENLDKGVPFYKLDVDPSDKPEVIPVKEGNFYLGFSDDAGNPGLIRTVVDPQDIFGQATDFLYPQEFLSVKNYAPLKQEVTKSKMPCAFSFINLTLPAGKAKTIYSLTGQMRSLGILNSAIPRIIAPGYISRKQQENKTLIEELQQEIATSSSSREFDLYLKQTYLDNIMRGGYPVILKSASGGNTVFYLYSRKHGDLERDYNKFQLQPSYFSQGNGNYRDTNQNRRMDVWFNPNIDDANLITFFSLIQADGFNPLVVKGASFLLRDTAGFRAALAPLTEGRHIPDILSFAAEPFSPGDIILFLEEKKIRVKPSYDEFLKILLSHCDRIQEAEHGEGFWSDHWTYNLDLLESYLGVYPERLKNILLEKRVFTFYDNAEMVKPRSEKYVLKDGRPRQLHSLYADHAKREMIKKRTERPHAARADYGKTQIYQTNLLNKLLCLLTNKLCSLDPFGTGIEMEADKPNWYDALNGLPALFGSSISETFELKRLVLFLKQSLKETGVAKIYVTEEVHEVLLNLGVLLGEWLKDRSEKRDYLFWDKSNLLKENYRQKTKLGFSGNELELDSAALLGLLDGALKKIDTGIDKARDRKSGLYHTYFINAVSEYKTIKEHFIWPSKFKQIRVPFFLEGQMHALRLSDSKPEAEALYKATRLSGLYDKKLKMYKVTADLSSMPLDIGRCRVFAPGWLENESVWLHMEYKYLLELLKQGLTEDFYAEFRNTLIPFQKPLRYGRSILENSSFLVSSRFVDESLHGNGFVARLSGSTAELLQIWLLMSVGRQPFFLDQKNELNLRIQPLLAGWLFDRNGTYCFNFLSKICVVYYNPKRKGTFGKNAAKVRKIVFNDKDGKLTQISSAIIPAPYAAQIRERQINRLDVYFG